MTTPLTNEAAVTAIIDTDLETPQITQYINDASLWVREELFGASLTNDRLELITRYLACALIRLRDLGVTNARWDDVSESYQVDPQVSDYLLRAAAFDPTGKLRAYFMAPKNTRRAQWRVGTGYAEDV